MNHDASAPNGTAPGIAVYALVFLLTATDFLQAGMTAFGSVPIAGELSLSPEDFSLIAALYASIAIVAISMQHWLVERFGARRHVQVSASLLVLGATLCALSHEFPEYLAGRILMAAGGGGMFTCARMVIHRCLVGPKRFMGIRCLSGGLSASLAAAPLIAALAVANETWSVIYWVTAALGLAVVALAGQALPVAKVAPSGDSRLDIWHQALLLLGSAGLLYGMQRLYYDFYGDRARVVVILGLSIVALGSYFRLQYRSASPLLRVGNLLRPRYLTGLAIFLFAYMILGANNMMIPVLLQRGLGYGWSTVGQFEAVGFSAAVVTWWVMMRSIPKHPSPRKYLFVGFAALGTFAVLLSGITPDASAWRSVIPALALNSVFLLTVMPTTAMQSFREVEQNEAVFANAQQLKNMMSQVGIALGVMVATVGQQWRIPAHADGLSDRIGADNPIFQQTLHDIQAALPSADPVESMKLATAMIARSLDQQSLLLAHIDYFVMVAALAAIGALVVVFQRIIR